MKHSFAKNKPKGINTQPLGMKICDEEEIQAITQMEQIYKKIDPSALEKIAKSLRNKVKNITKKKFFGTIPHAYIDPCDPKPPYFRGKYLMYFTDHEYIKLNLINSKVVSRTPLPRADLSPLFYSYDIWSEDGSKVLVFKNRCISRHSNLEIFIFDTRKGEYTEISKSLKSSFKLGERGPIELFLECFDPLSNSQLIIREITQKQTRMVEGRNFIVYTNEISYEEKFYCWNYQTGQKRLFHSDPSSPVGASIFPFHGHVLITNHDCHLHSSRYKSSFRLRNLTLFSTKGFKKVLKVQEDEDFEHGRDDFTSQNSASSNGGMVLFYQSYYRRGTYELGLKDRSGGLIFLDVFQRKLNLGQNKDRGLIAVSPEKGFENIHFNDCFKKNFDGKALFKDFWDLNMNTAKLIQNHIKIFEDQRLLMKISQIESNDRTALKIDCYKLFRSDEGKVAEFGAKDLVRQKQDGDSPNSASLVNSTLLHLSLNQKPPFYREKSDYSCKIIGRKFESKFTVSSKDDLKELICHKVFDLDSRTLETVRILEQEVPSDDVARFLLKSMYKNLTRLSFIKFSSLKEEYSGLMTGTNVAEIRPNLFANLETKELVGRNFYAELQDLWKMSMQVTKGNLIEVLVRFLGLGFEYKELLNELGVENYVRSLTELGWSAGYIYYKEVFGL